MQQMSHLIIIQLHQSFKIDPKKHVQKQRVNISRNYYNYSVLQLFTVDLKLVACGLMFFVEVYDSAYL